MARGGVGSTVGGAAGDNGSGGGGWGQGWLSEAGGTLTIGFDRADNGSNNNRGGPTGPNGNGGGNGGSGSQSGGVTQNDYQAAAQGYQAAVKRIAAANGISEGAATRLALMMNAGTNQQALNNLRRYGNSEAMAGVAAYDKLQAAKNKPPAQQPAQQPATQKPATQKPAQPQGDGGAAARAAQEAAARRRQQEAAAAEQQRQQAAQQEAARQAAAKAQQEAQAQAQREQAAREQAAREQAAREEAARQEAARVEAERQANIARENTARTNLQNQINQATSTQGLQGLKGQLDSLGGMDPNAQGLNQAVRDAYQGMTERLGEREQRNDLAGKLAGAKTYADVQALRDQIAGLGTKDATAEQNAAMLAGLDKQATAFNEAETNAAISGAQRTAGGAPIGQATGSPVSAAQQAKNTAEASRVGGYDDRSTADRLGDVAKAALGGAGIGGAPGAVVGAVAEAYNSFISNTRQAGSSTQTGNMDASKPSAGNALAGMTTGAIKGAGYGSFLGPGGALAGAALGAIWGGATAAGVAPSAENLKGQSPLEGGQVTNVGSYGPQQQLVNGAWVGNANGKDNTSGSKPVQVPVPNVGGGATTGSPNVTNPGGENKPPTGTPVTPPGTPDGSIKAGNSAFNNYLSELRRRQMQNLLSTGAGYSGTSGTALLGRVGASQGAVGGLSGYVQSNLGGGKSLLGGAWSW